MCNICYLLVNFVSMYLWLEVGYSHNKVSYILRNLNSNTIWESVKLLEGYNCCKHQKLVSRLWQWKYIFCWNFTAILHYQMIVSKLFVPYNHLFLLCFWWFTLVIIILCISMMLHLLLAWVGQKSMTRLQRNLWLALWRRKKNYICWSKDIMYFSPWKFILLCILTLKNWSTTVTSVLLQVYIHACTMLDPCHIHCYKYGTIFVYTGLWTVLFRWYYHLLHPQTKWIDA